MTATSFNLESLPFDALPLRLEDRVIIEPFNGYNEDDGVFASVYSNDPVDDRVIFQGLYKTHEAAVKSLCVNYYRGLFT